MTGERPCNTLRVMRGLDPRIHVFGCFKTWMAGIKPAMTDERR
jgi:hypothetical protein